MFIEKRPFAHLISKFVLVKLLQAELLFYDKYLDTSFYANKTIQVFSLKYILAS